MYIFSATRCAVNAKTWRITRMTMFTEHHTNPNTSIIQTHTHILPFDSQRHIINGACSVGVMDANSA